MTEEQRSPIGAALDLIFYAPVGLAMTAREELPRLIEKGRQRVNSQLTMAKMIGQFAVNQGGQEAGKLLKQATDTLSGLGILPTSQPPPGPTGTVESVPAPPAEHGGNGKAASNPLPLADAEAVGIPGYDSLSASQVVQRLAGLSIGELEAVRAYEAATRGRRTILARIVQLQADRS